MLVRQRLVRQWFVHLVLLTGSTAAMAQSCPAGNPRVAPDSRYSIAEPMPGQFVVTDLFNGLMWQRCPLFQTGVSCTSGAISEFTWGQALLWANLNANAGFTDWRLPNAEELLSLVETGCHTPAINAVVFPSTQPASFWSSTTYAPLASVAWAVRFSDGFLTIPNKSTSAGVRLVRGGHSLDAFDSGVYLLQDGFESP